MTASAGLVACGFDGDAFDARDDVVVCDRCGARAHAACWERSKRCAKERCPGKPQPAVVVERIVAAEAPAFDVGQQIRSALAEVETRIDRSIGRSQKGLFDAIAGLRSELDASTRRQAEQSDRIHARVVEAFQRLRSLDLLVTRHLLAAPPPPRTPPASSASLPATAAKRSKSVESKD